MFLSNRMFVSQFKCFALNDSSSFRFFRVLFLILTRFSPLASFLNFKVNSYSNISAPTVRVLPELFSSLELFSMWVYRSPGIVELFDLSFFFLFRQSLFQAFIYLQLLPRVRIIDVASFNASRSK